MLAGGHLIGSSGLSVCTLIFGQDETDWSGLCTDRARVGFLDLKRPCGEWTFFFVCFLFFDFFFVYKEL